MDARAKSETELAILSGEAARAGVTPLLHARALDAIPAHYLILDARDARALILFANAAAARDFGMSADQLLGRSFIDLVAPEQSLSRLALRIARCVLRGREVKVEFEYQRSDGARAMIGMTLAPLIGDTGRVSHAIAFGRDITRSLQERRKRRELQEQLYREMQARERMTNELRLAQRLESVGRLASGIAHEINTPIQYIGDSVHFLKSAHADLRQIDVAYRGVIDALRDDPAHAPHLAGIAELERILDRNFLDAEVPQALERTQEGIARVASIVQAMKEFAHPGSPEQSAADINRAIETTLLVARNEYKYIARVETHFGDLPQALCNVGELNQVFLNLIVNAAHAIQDAGKGPEAGLISIQTRVTGEDVEIAIADNGCGIPPAHIEHVFDPFFTTKEVGRGSGQGLAIVHTIVVEKHAGTIAVDSAVGHGTRMSVRIPAAGRTARG